MTRDWRVVAFLACAIALVVIGVVFLTHHAGLKKAPTLVRYYSTIFPSEDFAQQKLRLYRARIEQAGGTITIQTLGMVTSSYGNISGAAQPIGTITLTP